MIWQPTQGTVEERMEAVQARKQRMISGALTDQEVRTARIEELKMLFSWAEDAFLLRWQKDWYGRQCVHG